MPPPASRSSRDGHHTPEFEGAAYSLESMVRKFVKAPVLAYQPSKGGETDPEIAPILERGMRYIGNRVGGLVGVVGAGGRNGADALAHALGAGRGGAMVVR